MLAQLGCESALVCISFVRWQLRELPWNLEEAFPLSQTSSPIHVPLDLGSLRDMRETFGLFDQPECIQE
jgi:hypothetical protein